MSTTTNLGLFKHDNPSTNTDIFDVDKALNQNWDKVDTGIGKDRERLDLLEVSNTIYNFKGKADTLNTIKSKTATKGDVWYCIADSTYYAYNGTDWIPVNLNLKLEVIDELQAKTIKCLQEVETPTPVSGENIDINDSAEAKITELNIRGNSVQKIREGDNVLKQKNISDFSKNGVDIACNSDGTIYVFGTASDVVDITLCGLWASTEVQFSLKAGQYKYTSNNSGVSLYLVNNTSAKKVEDNAILTLTEDYDVTDAFIRIESGKTVDVIIKPMLYLYQGIEREYEQYGVSPSSDYTSEVESCGDNVQLFNKDSAIKGAYYNSSNVLTTSTTWKYFEFIPKSKRDYTIKSTKYASEVYFVGFDSSGNSTIITNFSSNKVTFNSSNYAKIGYSVHKDDLDNVKLVEGTHVGEYSIYGQGCINEVICNKNLAYTDFESGDLNASNGDNEINSARIRTKDYICIKPNQKYVLSPIAPSRLVEYDENKKFIRALFSKTTFTTSAITKYIRWSYSQTVVTDVQLEEGSTVTNYIEPESQIYTIPTQQPFRACGDYADTFIKKNNKWFERHSIARLILNGTENWNMNIATSLFQLQLDKKAIREGGGLSNCYSYNKIQGSINTNLKDGEFAIQVLDNGTYFYVKNEECTTLETFVNKVNEQNLTLDYPLATPLDIECTEEQSTILWDIEQNAKTYKNITHMYSTDEISPVIEVTYKKDIETLFANTLVESGV